MVNNCLAAILAARCANIPAEYIVSGVAAFSPVAGRMKIFDLNDNITIIDDTYNANPSSVARALETLAHMSPEKKKIAVLGDMLELGKTSDELHRSIGRKAASTGISKLYAFGNQAVYLVDGAREQGLSKELIFHGQKEEIASLIYQEVNEKTLILIKGSRGMKMETIIQKLKEFRQNNHTEGIDGAT